MTTKITTTPTPLAVVDTINSIIDDKLDKTGTAASATTLSGLTATVTELNYVDGVTSNIQTQLNGKLSTSGKAASATKADTATTAGNVTGTIAIANGGTGATTAERARANLGISSINTEATDYIIESYRNGTEWYDIYKSGKIRQGGRKARSVTTITFLKAFANTDYTFTPYYLYLSGSSVNPGEITGNSGDFGTNIGNVRSTTGITKTGTTVGDWVAEGQGA